MKYALAAILGVWAALLAGCATGPKIHSVYNEQIDFTRYQTFAFKPIASDGYLTLADQYLQAAVARELTTRGYQSAPATNADVLIDILQSDKEKITSRPSGPIQFDYVVRHRNVVTVAGIEQELHQYTEGTLVVRMVDQVKNAVVWESIAIDQVDPPQQDKMRLAIDQVVAKMFVNFPVAPPITVAP